MYLTQGLLYNNIMRVHVVNLILFIKNSGTVVIIKGFIFNGSKKQNFTIFDLDLSV